MSDFWAKALGTGNAPAPSQRPAATVTQRPWWDSVPVPAPVSSQVIEQQQPTLSKAVSARMTSHCPECGSENYFKPQGQPNAMTQCYGCGYNPRFMHSTAGAGMPSDSSAPTRPARQVSTANNYNPGVIVGKVE